MAWVTTSLFRAFRILELRIRDCGALITLNINVFGATADKRTDSLETQCLWVCLMSVLHKNDNFNRNLTLLIMHSCHVGQFTSSLYQCALRRVTGTINEGSKAPQSSMSPMSEESASTSNSADSLFRKPACTHLCGLLLDLTLQLRWLNCWWGRLCIKIPESNDIA